MRTEEKRAVLANHARLFLTAEKYRPKWNKVETNALRPFFTNTDGRVFFIHSLPENIVTVLMAMYSRLKDKRGIRGIFVDSLLPHILSGNLTEVSGKFGGSISAFLKQNKIASLEAFVMHSRETEASYNEFLSHGAIDPDYIEMISSSPRIKNFLEEWPHKFGHKSILRMGKVTLCAENVSLLAAKSFEWTRPGSGYIELSTRYVDMSGKDLYPIQDELAEFGFPADEIVRVMNLSFGYYRNYQGKNFDGPLPEFLRKKYGKAVTDAKDLENGVIGESCDVLGNFLPCATLTSLGAAVSGEALSQLLKHLILDDTPENLILVEMIMEEAKKLGYDQFARHFEPTEWEKSSWGYLDSSIFGCHESLYQSDIIYNTLSTDEIVQQMLNQSFFRQPEFRALASFGDIIDNLKNKPRSQFDKLPNHFEAIPAVFCGLMSFRGWRDLQRQQFLTHYRSYVTPEAGFYEYDKPAPKWFFDACDDLWCENRRLFDKMKEANIPPQLMQYPMALGNLVAFQVGGNLLEIEFCNWQRTKFSVNHEVRKIFLAMEKALRMQYPWWKVISRADMTDAYIFARTKEGVSLV